MNLSRDVIILLHATGPFVFIVRHIIVRMFRVFVLPVVVYSLLTNTASVEACDRVCPSVKYECNIRGGTI